MIVMERNSWCWDSQYPLSFLSPLRPLWPLQPGRDTNKERPVTVSRSQRTANIQPSFRSIAPRQYLWQDGGTICQRKLVLLNKIAAYHKTQTTSLEMGNTNILCYIERQFNHTWAHGQILFQHLSFAGWLFYIKLFQVIISRLIWNIEYVMLVIHCRYDWCGAPGDPRVLPSNYCLCCRNKIRKADWLSLLWKTLHTILLSITKVPKKYWAISRNGK